MDETSENRGPQDEASQERGTQDDLSGNGAGDQAVFVPADSVSRAPVVAGSARGKAEEFHRPPTRIERLRAWLEGLPRVRLYVTLFCVVWFSLTLLVGVNVNPFASRGGPNPWTAMLGVGIVVATKILRENTLVRILLAASLLILFTALARVFVSLSLPLYLIPLPGLSILGTILLGPRLMFVMVVITGVNVGIIAGSDFFLTAALLLVSGLAIYTVLRVGRQMQLLRAGLLIALVSAIVTFAVALIEGLNLRSAVEVGGIGLANGLLSLTLAMVLLPLFESTFNILTPMKLLELSDTGHSLLQELLRSAPGTFTHSMQVGSLAANAAERIEANPLLARVGAYYHDVGKLEHPYYFIENQISRMNPHSALTPALSARIIKRHVKEGLALGREWNLPIEVLDMVAQHHGTTRIEYFYRKALEEAVATGASVNESDFRYPGPCPKSKEAGILMLADSIEATVKSLEKPTPKRIEDIVHGTIRSKLEDGQFDQCELTMREIHATGEAILEALIGFIGPRIEYPDDPNGKAKPA